MSAKKNQEVTEKPTTQKAVADVTERTPEVADTNVQATAVEKPATAYYGTAPRITSPDETKYLANDLARFIRENKLFHNIQGKEYVNVEGWQYAGSRLGILPVVDELERIREGFTGTPEETSGDRSEIKYQAKVKLLDLRSGQIIGTGFAICSNRESSKKYYQEFAIASMAQTRAIGKAYRNILAWIIRAAGYEPTPAEEMDYVAVHQSDDRRTEEAVNKVTPKVEPVPAPQAEAKEPAANFVPVTINQKTQILLLLNNSVISKEEKERMVAKINTFDTERAEQAIAKLKKVIKERTATPSGHSGMAA